MNKDELLKRLKEENELNDPYEKETSQLGWTIGSIGAITCAIVIFFLELLLWGKYNFGVFIVLTAMLGLSYTIRSIRIKNLFNIVMATVFGLGFIASVIIYAFMLCYGWI